MSANAPFVIGRYWLSTTVTAAVGLFLIVPLLILVTQSFTAESFLQFPPPRYGLRWYLHIAESEKWRDAAARSLSIAAIVAPSALAIGALAAFGLDRGPMRGRGLLFGILISPMVLPHVVLALGFFRAILFVRAEDTIAALVLAHLIVAVPYVVVTIGASLQNHDRAQEEAAQSLGARGWQVIWHVVLPGIRPGLIAGLIFSFIASFDEFIMSFFVATFNMTLPLQIFSTLSFQVEPSIAAVSTLMLMLTALLTGLIMARGQIVASGRVVG